MPFGKVLWALATSFFPLALLIMSVLGAILFGLATPSEAAGAGALGEHGARRRLSARSTSRMLQGFGLSRPRAPPRWSATCSSAPGPSHRCLPCSAGSRWSRASSCRLNLSPTGFLLLTQIIIFLLGWPLEWTEIIIIFVPIFLPLLDDFSVDPIFFGILVALNTQTAFNTPPVAMAAFYLKGVAPPHVKLTDIFSGALPFVFMVFVTMALVYIFPQIALWLPDYLYTPR